MSENRLLAGTPGASDLASERHRILGGTGGVCKEQRLGELLLTALTVDKERGARLDKPCGRYLAISFPPRLLRSEETEASLSRTLAAVLAYFLLPASEVLVAGLGNRRLTPDAFGPMTADGISVTAALPRELAKIGALPPTRVSVCAPDVFAHTGIESVESIAAAARLSRAQAVLAVDALASSDKERLLTVFEISDSGTVPGAGMKRGRAVLSSEALGIPVVALGLPTAVRVDTSHFLVPQELEEGVTALASVASHAIDLAFGFSPPTLPFPLSSLFTEEKT